MPKHQKLNYRIGGAAAFAVLVFIGASALLAAGQTAVTTYHYDNNRTGWNHNESVLTPANVGSPSFGLLQAVPLDDQVDAQPLVVPGVQITAGNYQGTHDVVYVATENNTVYAIDVHTGTVLLNPNFGTPLTHPLSCGTTKVGINSTPVIDTSSNTLYVMILTQDPSGPAYRLHALDLGSLTDKVTPQVVTASHTLNDGTTFNFNAGYERQRPALLLANGSIYAGFARRRRSRAAGCWVGRRDRWRPFPRTSSTTSRQLRVRPALCPPSGCQATDRRPMMRATSCS
jgi:hypothetical protein